MLEASPTKVKEPTSGNRSIINLFGEGLTLRACKGDIASYSWAPAQTKCCHCHVFGNQIPYLIFFYIIYLA